MNITKAILYFHSMITLSAFSFAKSVHFKHIYFNGSLVFCLFLFTYSISALSLQNKINQITSHITYAYNWHGAVFIFHVEHGSDKWSLCPTCQYICTVKYIYCLKFTFNIKFSTFNISLFKTRSRNVIFTYSKVIFQYDLFIFSLKFGVVFTTLLSFSLRGKFFLRHPGR